jgi:hypothetical protein
MTYRLIIYQQALENKQLMLFNDIASEEDKLYFTDYIDNVVTPAANQFDRIERTVLKSDETARIVAYDFNTKENAEGYLQAISNTENIYFKALNDKARQYEELNSNHVKKTYIIEI